MKFVLNILKAFLISFLFIGITYAATSCPAISPKLAGDGPTEQVEAIINDIVCAFIDLHNQNGFMTSIKRESSGLLSNMFKFGKDPFL